MKLYQVSDNGRKGELGNSYLKLDSKLYICCVLLIILGCTTNRPILLLFPFQSLPIIIPNHISKGTSNTIKECQSADNQFMNNSRASQFDDPRASRSGYSYHKKDQDSDQEEEEDQGNYQERDQEGGQSNYLQAQDAEPPQDQVEEGNRRQSQYSSTYSNAHQNAKESLRQSSNSKRGPRRAAGHDEQMEKRISLRVSRQGKSSMSNRNGNRELEEVQDILEKIRNSQNGNNNNSIHGSHRSSASNSIKNGTKDNMNDSMKSSGWQPETNTKSNQYARCYDNLSGSSLGSSKDSNYTQSQRPISNSKSSKTADPRGSETNRNSMRESNRDGGRERESNRESNRDGGRESNRDGGNRLNGNACPDNIGDSQDSSKNKDNNTGTSHYSNVNGSRQSNKSLLPPKPTHANPKNNQSTHCRQSNVHQPATNSVVNPSNPRSNSQSKNGALDQSTNGDGNIQASKWEPNRQSISGSGTQQTNRSIYADATRVSVSKSAKLRQSAEKKQHNLSGFSCKETKVVNIAGSAHKSKSDIQQIGCISHLPINVPANSYYQPQENKGSQSGKAEQSLINFRKKQTRDYEPSRDSCTKKSMDTISSYYKNAATNPSATQKGNENGSSNRNLSKNKASKSEASTQNSQTSSTKTTKTKAQEQQIVKQKKAKYKYLKELGRGQCGKVYLAAGDKAVKEIDLQKLPNDVLLAIKNQVRSLKALSSLRHKNIVGFEDYYEDDSKTYIVMEYCPSSLDTLLKSNQVVGEIKAFNLFAQIINGYKQLFNNNIIHRDLKPVNILIGKDNECKIADFGFAKICDTNDLCKTRCCTPLYAAPEVLLMDSNDTGYDYKCDIWSLGAIFYELLTKRTPLEGSSQRDLKIKMEELKNHKLDLSNLQVSDSTKNLLQRMLTYNRHKRIGLDQLFEEYNKIINELTSSLHLSKCDSSNYSVKLISKSDCQTKAQIKAISRQKQIKAVQIKERALTQRQPQKNTERNCPPRYKSKAQQQFIQKETKKWDKPQIKAQEKTIQKTMDKAIAKTQKPPMPSKNRYCEQSSVEKTKVLAKHQSNGNNYNQHCDQAMAAEHGATGVTGMHGMYPSLGQNLINHGSIHINQFIVPQARGPVQIISPFLTQMGGENVKGANVQNFFSGQSYKSTKRVWVTQTHASINLPGL